VDFPRVNWKKGSGKKIEELQWGEVMRSYFSTTFKAALLFACLMFCSLSVAAQTAALRPSRITQAVDNNNLVTLYGNTHPLARPQYDQGPAEDSLPMERMLMVLQRGPDQEAALKTLMEAQQAKSSASYHQWLTPQQFGEQFGPADADIQTVTNWLESQGFQVNRVANGKMLIEFTGTAGLVRQAFHTEIHKYVVKGDEHYANASDPQIPAALAPVIKGIDTLHNFRRKAEIKKLGMFQRAKETGKVTPLSPQYSFSGCNSGITGASLTCNALGPTDFATIYNMLPLWTGSSGIDGAGQAIDGTGQTIAIVGDSEICSNGDLSGAGASPDFGTSCQIDDIQTFRTLFGLAKNNTRVILDGPDPGFNGDETEADLDVEWSGAIAKGATVLFVIAEGTEATAGIDLAAEHIVDNDLAPVLSESFGECEPFLLNSGNTFYQILWEQAAAQGITVGISAGDDGSAGCDDENSETVAEEGTWVNGIASTPFNVALGGTDFDVSGAGYQSKYWSATNNGISQVSALSYIPETTWNDSCAMTGTSGCNLQSPFTSNIVGGSGGPSNCSNSNSEYCFNGYAKPSFQSLAVTGVPNDMVRDVPDLSLFAADGFVSGSFYIICESDLNTVADTCNFNAPFTTLFGVGGTSASAPSFAGIMAMVNQAMANHASGAQLTNVSAGQGNANYVLYSLAASQSPSACNSSTGPGTNCIFNDVTKGNNSVPCVPGTQACSVTNGNSDVLGVEETVNSNTNLPTGTIAYGTTEGYDQATGLGSVNVTNLVSGWVNAAFTPTTSTLSLTSNSVCPGGTPAGTTVCGVHGLTTVDVNTQVTSSNGTPVGDVSLVGTCLSANPGCFGNTNNMAGVNRFTDNSYIISNEVTPSNCDANGTTCDYYLTLSGGSASGSTTSLVGGTYTITAHYGGGTNPAGGIFGGSYSTSPAQVTISPEGSKSSLSVLNVEIFNGGEVAAAGTSQPYGSLNLVRVDVVGATSGQENATGTVTLNDSLNGAAQVSLGTFGLNSEGYLEYQSPNVSFPGIQNQQSILPALATGSHQFQAVYSGDPSYNASTSSNLAFTITQDTASTMSNAITSFPATVAANTNFSLSAFVDTESLGLSPSGTISFYYGGTTLIGTAPVTATLDQEGLSAAQATFTTAKLPSAGMYSITATYNGDTNYAAITSPGVVVNATGTTTGFTLTPTASAFSVLAGSPGSTLITVAATGGYTGTVGLTCSVSPTNGTATPTCTFTPSASVTLGASGTSTLNVQTSASTTLETYTVTVTGTGPGPVTNTITVMVTVTSASGGFTLSPNPSSATVNAGNTGSSIITVSSTGGFTGGVALTCSVSPTNLNDPPACQLQGSPVSLTNNATSGTATLSVSTTASFTTSVYKPADRFRGPGGWIVASGAGTIALTFIFLLWVPSMRKRRPAVVFASLFIMIGLVVVGCGSSSGGSGTQPVTIPGTAAGTYTVTITGTSGSTTASTAVTITVP
jgi:hypothetical protein